MRSPYAVLGVKKSAEANTIKSAYRVLAKTWHPDQNRHDPEASRRFAEITQAYRLLIDPDLRSEFDGGRINADGRKATSSRGFSANPFAAFREALRTRPKARADKQAQNSDTANNDISDFDAMVSHIFGDAASRSQTQASADQTPKGNRRRNTANKSGKAQPGSPAGHAQEDPLAALDELFARWKSIHEDAPGETPAGEQELEIGLADILTGAQVQIQLEAGREITLTIPAGIEDGEVLHAPLPGSAGAEVSVIISYAAHSGMRVSGRDLHMDAAVELRDAVLGGSIAIETLDGPVNIDLPEWTTGHAPLLVAGRGLPSRDGARGDLHVHLHIRLAEQRDGRLAELMRETRRSWYV